MNSRVRSSFASPVLALLLTSQLFATPLLTEPFNYTGTGASLVSQTGSIWTTVNSGDDILLSAGNLIAPSPLVSSSGNSIQFTGTGAEATAAFTSQTSGTVYYSMLLRVDSVTSVTAGNSAYISYITSTSSSSSHFAPLWTQKDGTTFDIGVSARSSTTPTFTTAQTLGSTLFVVVGYTVVGGTTNDEVRLWVNPSSGSFGGGSAPAETILVTNTGTDASSLAAFLFRQDLASTTPGVTIDELRIGTTWADVTPVPEPASLCMLVLAGATLFARRGRA